MGFKEDFVNKFLPYARQAADAVQMPVSVVLSQWALESDWGRSNRAVNHNNLGGIKFSKYSKTAVAVGDGFARYGSIGDFVTDYIRVLKLGYYDKVRAAEGIEATVRELAASPYDAGHYHGTGQSLLDIISDNNWFEFDGMLLPSAEDAGVITVPSGLKKEIIPWVLIAAAAVLAIDMLGGSRRVPEVKTGAK